MNEVVTFLKDNSVQYFSTIGLDGKPKVRPFQFLFEDKGKLFFCTSNQKEVYAQLKQNPYVEISAASKTFAWIRLNGKVEFTMDLNLKTKALAENELVKNIYQTPDNPTFELFYLEDAKATIADFSGNPPKEYLF